MKKTNVIGRMKASKDATVHISRTVGDEIGDIGMLEGMYTFRMMTRPVRMISGSEAVCQVSVEDSTCAWWTPPIWMTKVSNLRKNIIAGANVARLLERTIIDCLPSSVL